MVVGSGGWEVYVGGRRKRMIMTGMSSRIGRGTRFWMNENDIGWLYETGIR